MLLVAGTLTAGDGAARCTKRADFHALRASLRAALGCAERALHGRTRCTASPPPPCAATAVADAAALVFATPPGPLASPIASTAQLRCEHAIALAARHFVALRAAERLAGHRAEDRSRRSMLSVLEHCAVPVRQDAGGEVLPQLGGACAGVIGPVGSAVDPERLVQCLRPALERIVSEVAPQALQPNILVVLTDDQRWDTLGYMPAVTAALVERGLRFDNSFVSDSLCCPSRATLYSGQYARHHGVVSNGPPQGGAAKFHAENALAVWLSRAGYTTALFGKYMNAYARVAPAVPPGWNEWQAFVEDNPLYYDYTLDEDGRLIRYGHTPADYSTDLLRERALTFIRSHASRPFFVVYAPFAPHEPAIPAPRHAGRLDGIAPWRPPSWNEPDVSDKPAWVQFLKAIRTPPSIEMADLLRTNQLETLLAVDEAVGAIVELLERLGLSDDTAVVFTSDNGFMWSEHWWVGKLAGFEESIRVPLVIRYPVLTPTAAARDDLVLNVDLAPTFAELAGVTIPAAVDGRSLLGLLRGETWRQDFLIENYVNVIVSRFEGVRTPRWKFIRNQVTGGIAEELYDLAADPYELQNQARDPAYADVRALLAARLDAYRVE
jgi:N-acetylglucosamine-6-sulfatase